MNAKHTPGPWQVRCNDMVYDSGWRIVADCESLDKSKRPAPPTEEDMANARLISAAPEMLAALESCEAALRLVERETGKSYAATINARAAISKARGTT